ncbi:MAG: hypothetical protein QF371_02045 [Flavobacteriales bacterium]|jgi:hypothetical protein|nr:hypothetical protein [Flavobacteriales bacterium]
MGKLYFTIVLKFIVLTICCGLQTSIVNAQEVIDFAGLPAGTLLAEQYAAQGIHISSDADDGHPDLVMVFNSDASGTADPDLEVAILPYFRTALVRSMIHLMVVRCISNLMRM